jgi:transcriptional regulator with XRE-family HTH domain
LYAARRFELFLEAYRRPDGDRWGGADLKRATNGILTRSYVTNLRKGRIESPGYEKMLAIARAMGFPPAAWFKEMPGDGTPAVPTDGQDLAARAERLFDTIMHPRTGEPYENAGVARMSVGELTEDEVEKIRTGVISDPPVSQVAALAAVFGVPPSYLLDWDRDPSVLDGEALDALSDETAGAILRGSARLPEREKTIVLGIVRQFESQRAGPSGERSIQE